MPPGDVLSHDVMTYDLTGGTLAGADGEFVSAARQDDLACSHASVTALCAATAGPGARAGPAHQRGRAVRQRGGRQPVGHRRPRRVAGPAAGTQRPRPRRDARRLPARRRGLTARVRGHGARHASELRRAARARALGRARRRPGHQDQRQRLLQHDGPHARGVPARGRAGRRAGPVLRETYSGAPSGSTIGPIVAAGLAIPTVDVGNPTLAMHSARELSGRADAAMMIAAMTAFLRPA